MWQSVGPSSATCLRGDPVKEAVRPLLEARYPTDQKLLYPPDGGVIEARIN